MPRKKTARSPAKAGTRRRKSAAGAKKKTAGRQIDALLTFAAAVFLGAMLLVHGKNLWSAARGALFGLFGPCAFLLPLCLLYIAIEAGFDKREISVPFRFLQAFLFLVLLSSAVQIFTVGHFPGITKLYNTGRQFASGGVMGAPGALLYKLFGQTGAAVTDILLIIVSFLLCTGITIAEIFQAVSSAARNARQARGQLPKKATGSAEVVIGGSAARNKSRYNIDVDLGPAAERRKQRNVPEALQKRVQPMKENTAVLDDLVGKIARMKEPDAVETPAPQLEVQKPETVIAETGKAAEAAAPQEGAAQQQVYTYPPTTLLKEGKATSSLDVAEELKGNAALLVDTLRSFGVETRITDISRGPSVTRYELQPSAGVKISRITALSDDIALNLASSGVRIEAPIPNKAAVGIEVPNKNTSIVHIRDLLDSSEFRSSHSKLTVALGRDIAGNVALANIASMPHMLIAGATGSGKSVCINAIIMSLLYKASPDEVRLLLVDPKIVELGVYNGIPHLLVPVVTEPRKAAGALNWAVNEMEQRYKLFADNSVRDLKGYNALAHRTEGLTPMPQIVIIIDELADLIMAAPHDVEDSICRIAQKARAAGMHLVIATQRPSVDVITGLIKANIPTRLAFAVSSQVDSRTILDTGGAEKLLGRGDMLFWPVGAAKPTRIQGCFVSDDEVESVINFIKGETQAEYDENVIDEINRQAVEEKGEKQEPGGDKDAMFDQAVECVVDAGLASTSLLQRRLKLGYARAARIIDEMEQRGIVGPFEGSKPRQVLITRQQWLEMTTTAGN